MSDFSKRVERYTEVLEDKSLAETYQEIIEYMRSLRQDFINNEKSCKTGGLYEGLMDMTYFSITTDVLLKKRLKLAVVFVHGKGSLELWISGRNREALKKYRSHFPVDSGFSFPAFHEEDNVDALLEFILAERKELPEKEDAFQVIQPVVKEILEQMETLLSSMD